MKKHRQGSQRSGARRLGLLAVSGLLLTVLFGLSQAGIAAAAAIPSTPPGTISVSIYQVDTATQRAIDVTDTWMPSVTIDANGAVVGQEVFLVVNVSGLPVTNATVSLVDTNPATLAFNATTAPNPTTNPSYVTVNPFVNPPTTSRYRGVCTNYGSNTDTGLDFALLLTSTSLTTATGGSVSGFKLTSLDCGGRAVVTVNGTATVVVPADTDNDGIPNIYEAQFPQTSCKIGTSAATTPPLDATGDLDCTPVPAAATLKGDGISNFDEYRGFIVSGVHKRTDWREKDFFVHLVNPQCGTGPSLLITYPTDGSPLFGNLDTLSSSTRVNVLGFKAGMANLHTSEWQDHFKSLTVTNTFSTPVSGKVTATSKQNFAYTIGTNGTGGDVPVDSRTGTVPAPADDRQININAFYPIRDTITARNYQKGLRITECLDVPVPPAGTTVDTATLLLGYGGWGSANGPDNATIYTQRMVNHFNTLFMNKTLLSYSFYPSIPGGTAWSQKTTTTNDFIISKAIQFYVAMELGHSVRLTSTSANQYHNAENTGSNLDIRPVCSDVGAAEKWCKIPSVYNSSDRTNFRLKN